MRTYQQNSKEPHKKRHVKFVFKYLENSLPIKNYCNGFRHYVVLTTNYFNDSLRFNF